MAAYENQLTSFEINGVVAYVPPLEKCFHRWAGTDQHISMLSVLRVSAYPSLGLVYLG
jgi:hypothetical protein